MNTKTPIGPNINLPNFWHPITNIGNFYNAIIVAMAYLERIESLDRNGPRVNSVIEVNPEAEALAASGGPFLFGAFGAADAFYAPVVMRLRTYALPVSEVTRAYGDRIVAAL